MATERPLAPEDLALIERVAERVVELRMEVPALLTLETAVPVSLITGQAMVFFEPFIVALFHLPDYRRFARLVERREALTALTQAIETRADAVHRECRSRARAEREARATSPPRS